ncbi:NAD(P)-binding domain-containing protein [Tahibacter harae]|uniref:NAD(P)-binding domain-containing protein n=1 Tax=Tahibacter harae TaxID=2963937 RepID=A0ABT1QT74_9GAMM|nr:NAD(P)-binding domain-containing protein [Tahibacter harae]MCQ4165493.1 NAD(P)-binding domain-containing protein [Tahibacter harae]
MTAQLPVVVIGAGPVGLAAAAHLLARGLVPLVLEAGPEAGAAIRRWAHVRLFSPWEFNVDRTAAALLQAQGWQPPDATHFPTGRELIEHYLQPLAATPAIAAQLRLGARVVAVTRQRRDRMKNTQREHASYVVRYEQDGTEHEVLAQAVIDASGTLDRPNPVGAAGIPALGERAAQAQIAYGIPDVAGSERSRYAGRRVLVVGSGHSALNVLADLSRLARDGSGTQIHWAIRRPSLRRVLGGGENDQLKERGRLGSRIGRLIDAGIIAVHTGTHLDRIARTAQGWVASGDGKTLPPVDEIVAATGFRPDLGFLDEVRLDLDPGTQAPRALAPLIDPNLHSCGSVPPHGATELQQPDANLYLVGMKSYGRAPTFLLLTGYEQVRSVAAAIAGDWEAARRVELVLPETGVCNTQFSDEEIPAAPSACCGGPAPAQADACCRADAEAKAEGTGGCGCGPATDEVPAPAIGAATVRRSACCDPARP